ncbi:MAG: rRNA maturation RNase YbeY [Bryobacteraceae bacterium]|nr:rRNA maturation RNase YbeY [Bryobacteraceae bacterium]
MKEDPLLIFAVATPGVDRAALRDFAHCLRQEVAAGRPFCCRITTDREVRELNRRFLGEDRPTDVLSFPSGQGLGSLGDIAIAFPYARRQAAAFGHPVETELRVLLLHGLLHLLGYDHETDGGRMRRAEQKWRRRLGLPHGLISRAGRGARR